MSIKIKLGVLGCAAIAKKSMIQNFLDSENFEITAIASRDINKAKQFCKTFGGEPIEGYEKLLEMSEIDSIYIPLPTGLSYKWAKRALNANKHVFVEKAICENLVQTKELIQIATQNKLIIFENFMFQENDQYIFVKDLLQQGKIGSMKLFRSSFGFPVFNEESNIRYKKSLGGGALLDAGTYVIKGVQFLVGDSQSLVSSIAHHSSVHSVDFHGYITFESETGIVSQLAYGFDNFYQNNIEIWGTKGKIIINKAYTSTHDFQHNIQVIGVNNEVETHLIESGNPGIKLCKKFGNAILTGNDFGQSKEILNQSYIIQQIQDKNK